MRQILAILCLILVAACDNLVPTPTPTYPLSAPTLEPSPTILPLMPTAAPYQGLSNPTAAALPGNSGMPPLAAGTTVPGQNFQPIQVTAPDGTQLSGDLYTSATQDISPGLLLLAPSSDVWLDLPKQLQQKGYTVLVMPLRPNLTINSATAVGDFEAMIQSLEQVADPGHLGVVGAQGGADVGLAGCAVEHLCDALVMLSPTSLDIAQNTITRYNPRPIYLAVAQNDSASYPIVQYLRGSAQGEVGYDSPEGSSQGATLLQADPTLSSQIIQWLAKELNS